MIDQERLINSFCELVKIDSPSDEEEEVARYLTSRLETLGFTVERDAHGNLIASEEGADPLMLSAHMDTVEPGRGIKPEVQGDRIVSDGTTILGGDCKAGVAAILEGLDSIAMDGGLRRPVQVVLTRGEEIGLVGAANLDYSMIRCRDAVVFDGNGPVNTLTGASPTYMRFDVNITGRGAHAGVEPEKGLSAIRIATEIINELPQGRLDDETTFNVGLITGGTVRNAVPVDASFGGEFRSHNTETIDPSANAGWGHAAPGTGKIPRRHHQRRTGNDVPDVYPRPQRGHRAVGHQPVAEHVDATQHPSLGRWHGRQRQCA